MGLFHFSWEGKLRTVSINRVDHAMVLLTFIDAEIISRVHSQLLIDTGGNQHFYLNRKDVVSLEDAEHLVHSIEIAVGKSVEQWAEPATGRGSLDYTQV
jgi:hypothetical protein